jgi:anti-sigma-K factor RskA
MRVDAVARATEVTAFAVSIEPIGGSTSPTGPIVLVGAVTAG